MAFRLWSTIGLKQVVTAALAASPVQPDLAKSSDYAMLYAEKWSPPPARWI